MDNKELLKELDKMFEECKKELGFKTSFKELDSVFFLKDFVISSKFVSQDFSRALCHRIVDTFNGWAGYLNSLIVPNPGIIAHYVESSMFDEDEKKEIVLLYYRVLELASRNPLIVLSKNKKMEGKFIDYAFKFWKKEFQPKMVKIIKKVNSGWAEKSK